MGKPDEVTAGSTWLSDNRSLRIRIEALRAASRMMVGTDHHKPWDGTPLDVLIAAQQFLDWLEAGEQGDE